MHLFDTGIKQCNNVELHYISLINVIKQYLMIHTRYRNTQIHSLLLNHLRCKGVFIVIMIIE